ncbi:hypothetical protein GQ44DRAFT_700605 [Phaeosphaeriaceae sp. PMI808]|nr:hypothetical protein GQ44DRAFT_700605 [Phaeosphaeriaceae sp. PMI808]
MPRKATRNLSASAARSSSKRPAQEDTPTRQSKRARATTRKSYAEPDTDDEGKTAKKLSSATDEDHLSEASGFEDPSDEDPSSESEQDEATSDDTDPRKSTPRGQRAKKSLPLHSKQVNEKELWKPGAKLAPGTRLIIKKPKARDAGDTPYMDETIHQNTMLFLEDLAENNDRQWLKLHDPDYRAALQDFTTFIEKLSEKVVEADELIPELPVKDVIYRIYRDVRFSKDQTPYKSYFSASWSRTGRKGPYAHYYVQIQPGGGSFVGGGMWQPEASALAKLRRNIDRKPHKIKLVLTNKDIHTKFLGTATNDKKKAVQAFVNLASNKSFALKKSPKGYDPNHKDIELLRLRSFTLGKKLSDDEVIGPLGLERIAETIACMVPFVSAQFIHSLMHSRPQSTSISLCRARSVDGARGEGVSLIDAR